LWDNLCSAGLLAIRGVFLVGFEQLGWGLQGVINPAGDVYHHHGERDVLGRLQVRVVTDAHPQGGNDRVDNAAAIPYHHDGDEGKKPDRPTHDLQPEPISGHPVPLSLKPIHPLVLYHYHHVRIYNNNSNNTGNHKNNNGPNFGSTQGSNKGSKNLSENGSKNHL
jgi:hypothetical protein